MANNVLSAITVYKLDYELKISMKRMVDKSREIIEKTINN